MNIQIKAIEPSLCGMIRFLDNILENHVWIWWFFKEVLFGGLVLLFYFSIRNLIFSDNFQLAHFSLRLGYQSP